MAVPSEVTDFIVFMPCRLVVHRNILSSILSTVAAYSSETSLEVYQITEHRITDDNIFKQYCIALSVLYAYTEGVCGAGKGQSV
jgi:hypothetical protein